MNISFFIRPLVAAAGLILLPTVALAQFTIATPLGCRSSTESGASGEVTVDTYTVTVTDVRICTQADCSDGGTSILAGPQQMRIAELATGNAEKSGLQGTTIPEGTYKGIQMSISREVSVKGHATFTAATTFTCVTKTGVGGLPVGAHSDASLIDSSDNATNMIMTIPSTAPFLNGTTVKIDGTNLVFISALPADQVVQEGYVFPGIDFSFGVRYALAFVPYDTDYDNIPEYCTAYLGAPSFQVKFGSAAYQDAIPVSAAQTIATNICR